MASVRRGVFGGTFDPVHIGHLLAAEEALAALDLSELLVVPAGEPWMRSGEDMALKEHRWAMVCLAVQSNRKLRPIRVELDRPGPSYTVDTIEALSLDGALGDTDWFFVLGADALVGLRWWKEPERILHLCRIAVVTRPSTDMASTLLEIEKYLPAASDRISVVPGVDIGVSATDIRRRCREGQSIKYRVPEAVETYIQEHGLYR